MLRYVFIHVGITQEREVEHKFKFTLDVWYLTVSDTFHVTHNNILFTVIRALKYIQRTSDMEMLQSLCTLSNACDSAKVMLPPKEKALHGESTPWCTKVH